MTIEAMKQALEALVGYELVYGSDEKDREAITSLRQAIEQAEKPFYKVEGPLHVVCQCDKCKAQPQREWVGLTDEELSAIYNQTHWNLHSDWNYERAIEQALKEKNA